MVPRPEPPLTIRSGRVKAARRLSARAARQRARRFVAEGPQAVREALASTAGAVDEVYATAAATRRHNDLAQLAQHAGVVWTEAADEVVRAVSGTIHPQGIAAVCRFVDVPLATLAGGWSLLAVGVEVRDPGNAGTLIRCADAAGADAVVFCGEGVDPYNPKAVRASAGSLFHLPIVVEADVPAVLAAIGEAGLTVLAADGTADLDLDQAEADGLLAGPTAWMFGNEARGLPEAVRRRADHAVAVALHGRAESLNLAAAAAVCLYASARVQRRSRG